LITKLKFYVKSITGAAWLSSVRVVKFLVKSCNERNSTF